MSVIKPRALKPGDLLGICAPAGPVDPDRLRKGMSALEELGFRVRVSDDVAARARFTAGDLPRRLRELQGLFADDEVAGIVAARGGAGSGGLLPLLDRDLIAAHPKVFVGYSDLTWLHLYLARLGHVSFHGPMAARELADATCDREGFRAAVTGVGPLYASEADDLLPVRPGSAEGRLRGGCLTILAAAAGTPWALRPDPEGTILFVEDVDEAPYRVDRMLLQLRNSGGLDGVRGLVFGDMRGCSPPLHATYTLEDVILEALAGLDVPIALGLSSGHTNAPAVTLPLGVRARLRCGEEASFEVLEPAVE